MDTHIIFRILLIIIAAFVLIWLINYYNVKQHDSSVKKEKFFDPRKEITFDNMKLQQVSNVQPADNNDDNSYRTVDFEFDTQKLPNDCFPRDKLSSEDLLPRDAANSKFSQINPSGTGSVADQNFLTSGYHIGINTIGSTMKNANLQLRSDPIIAKGSWPIQNSSIEPDLLRKSFNIAE